MSYDFLINQITTKWGDLHSLSNYLYNGEPSYLENGYFNYIFTPVSLHSFSRYLNRESIVFNQELWEFFTKCNGVRIALSAFSIYGFPNKKAMINPYDLLIENLRIHIEMDNMDCDDPNLMFFGSFSGSVVFAFDKTTANKKLYCYQRGTNTILKSFNSLRDLFFFFIPAICNEYDDRCNKKELNAEYLDIPVLANTVMTIPDLQLG